MNKLNEKDILELKEIYISLNNKLDSLLNKEIDQPGFHISLVKMKKELYDQIELLNKILRSYEFIKQKRGK